MNVKEIIEVDPEKMSGTPVFTGTRVPIRNLFDCLEAGDSLDEFLSDFPTVGSVLISIVLHEESVTQDCMIYHD